MCSRIRRNPKHIFECFLEVVPSQKENENPWVLQTYPASYKEKEPETMKTVPQFAFPCKFQITNVEHFSFVLTNLEAKWTFGFCRYAPSGETALVFLSSLPWHEFFYKLLNLCAELTQHKDSGQLTRFLEQLYNSLLPPPGLTFHLEHSQGQVFSSPTPNHLNLPSIPENRNLTEYYNAVDVNNMLIIFASMLNERRILVTSKKLSRLSACVQAANSIIYPMSWQHIFIPVLPVQLMDYLCAPMPFLIGVPEPILKRTRRSELGDVVILDADMNRVETPFDDLECLPAEVVSNLKKSLKQPANLLGDSVARAFLQALVHLIGGYRDALKYRQGEKITFNENAFTLSRSSSLQPFLEKMLQLQIFRQFVEERLELLNSGKGFSDEFEMECVVFTEKSNKKFKNQYTAITQNVRKEGGAFVKKVRSKANPAVKDAMKNVLDGSKIAKDKVKGGGKIARTKAKATYKDVKSRLKDNREEIRDDSSSVHSAPSSPVQSRSSTMNRYGTISNTQLPRQHTDLGFGRTLKYERFDPSVDSEDLPSPDFEDMPKLDMDIMADIDEIMQRNQIGRRFASQSSPSKVQSRESSRKPSVEDLIKLDNDVESVVFDPLAAPSYHRPEFNSVGGTHRKLSRTSNLSTVNDVTNRSTGKYENYVPPGGSSQNQFMQFMTSMTDQGQGVTSKTNQGVTKSSDDLLSEYDLNFSKLSVHNSQNSAPSLLQFQPGSSLFNGNHGLDSGPTYSRPVFPSTAPLPPPRAPSVSRGNTSFLYNSSLAPTSQFALPESTVMPVNQRLKPSENPLLQMQSCKDILAELDPLRKSSTERTSHTLLSSGELGPKPPAVPPRSRKQWTTFD